MSKTICRKCQWYRDVYGRRLRTPHQCAAPWPKAMDLITGKLTPKYESCAEKNTGCCRYFEPKLLRRIGNALVDFALPPKEFPK